LLASLESPCGPRPAEIDEAELDALVLTLQVEKEKRELELKALDLARAEAALELKTIRSPDDGVVAERALSGENTSTRSPISLPSRA
jgi:multidrug resistance efflux pump